MSPPPCPSFKLVIGDVKVPYSSMLTHDENRAVCADAVKKTTQKRLNEVINEIIRLKHKNMPVPAELQPFEKGWPQCLGCGKPKALHYILKTTSKDTWSPPHTYETTSNYVVFLCE